MERLLAWLRGDPVVQVIPRVWSDSPPHPLWAGAHVALHGWICEDCHPNIVVFRYRSGRVRAWWLSVWVGARWVELSSDDTKAAAVIIADMRRLRLATQACTIGHRP